MNAFAIIFIFVIIGEIATFTELSEEEIGTIVIIEALGNSVNIPQFIWNFIKMGIFIGRGVEVCEIALELSRVEDMNGHRCGEILVFDLCGSRDGACGNRFNDGIFAVFADRHDGFVGGTQDDIFGTWCFVNRVGGFVRLDIDRHIDRGACRKAGDQDILFFEVEVDA